MSIEKVEIQIPQNIYKKLEASSRKMNYETVEEFLLYVLEQLFPSEVEKLDKEEIQMVEQRLRDLGYM